MFDMHYDLLTAIYMAKLNNDFEEIKKWISSYNDNNVIGLIANMCFMSEKEMHEEYHPNYYVKDKPIFLMLKESIELVNKYINPNIDIIFSLEGCDYLNNPNELDELYEIGLRALAPVWNIPNKYGSGIRGDYGLTSDGEELIHKAIKLGIAIDLSHTNEKTFKDIISIVKKYRENGIYPVIYASHSNSKELCDRVRNLTDEQLLLIKEVDGYVGVMSNRNFVEKDALEENISLNALKESYMKHLIHIGNIIGFDHLTLSTDDMNFSLGDEDYKKLPIYEYESITSSLKEDLSKVFSEDIVEDIMVNNAKKILISIKGGTYERKSRITM